MPDAWLHRVKFRLIAEQVSGGAAASADLLAYEAPSRDLVGVPLTLMHPQPEAMSRVGVAISGLIEGYRNFVPSLLVGEETVFGAPVTFSTGGGVLDTADGGATEGETLAEWLEVTVTTPTGTATATRAVFDRVGEEARAAGPIDPTTIAPVDLVKADQPETSFLPLAGLWSFAVAAGRHPGIAHGADRSRSADGERPSAGGACLSVRPRRPRAAGAGAGRRPALQRRAERRGVGPAPNLGGADQKEASVGLDLFRPLDRGRPGRDDDG